MHHKKHKALQKAIKAMSITTEAQRNKLMHLENSLIMYGVYNAEILEKLVETAQVYIATNHSWNNYSQDNKQQYIIFIQKCRMLVVFSIT